MQTATKKVEELYKEFKRSGTDEPEELEYRQVARNAIKRMLEEVMANEIGCTSERPGTRGAVVGWTV